MKPLHPYFEKHWQGADVVLIAENSNGKKIYAQKAPLAENSSYFKAMFFSGFREASQEAVNVPCSYETMLEILRLVYNINTYEPELNSAAEMAKLYHVVDMFDFKRIRDICITRMKKEPNKGVLAAFIAGDHALMMEILEQMLPADVRKFLETDDDRLFFSKEDVPNIFKFLTKEKLRKTAYTPKKAGVVQKLEEVATEIEKPRIDLTNKWFMSDVAIKTKNSGGKLLYSNKTILSSYSKLFRKMFISNNDVSVSKKDFPVIFVDADFTAMKTILSIIHQCNTDFCHHSAYHHLLLYDMYHTVSKHELDMPLIRKLCADNLIEQATPGCLEVAVKLNLPRVKALILEKMGSDELRKWLSSGDKDLIYRDHNGEEVIVSNEATSPVLSMNNLRFVINALDKNRPFPQVKKPSVTPTIPIDDPHAAYRYEFEDVNVNYDGYLQKDPSPRTLGLFMNH